MKVITRTEWVWDAAQGLYLPALVESHDYEGQVAQCLGGGGDDGGARDARIAEARRQARVDEEVALINDIFKGGPAHKRGVDRMLLPGDIYSIPGRTFYDKAGNPIIAPSTAYGAPDSSDDANAGWQSVIDAFGRGDLFSNVADVPAQQGFDDAYFNNIADSYQRFQKPLFEEQLATARRELPYQFASSDSAEYLRKRAELERDAERELSNIASQGQDFANKQRADVEQNKSDLIGLATGGADVNAVTQAANARAASLSRPPIFSPIADLFQKYTAASALNPALVGAPAAPQQRLFFASAGNNGGNNSVRMID